MTGCPLGDAARYPASQTASSVARHHDQIDMLGTGDIKDARSRRSISQHESGLESFLIKFLLYGFQIALGFLKSILTRFSHQPYRCLYVRSGNCRIRDIKMIWLSNFWASARATGNALSDKDEPSNGTKIRLNSTILFPPLLYVYSKVSSTAAAKKQLF